MRIDGCLKTWLCFDKSLTLIELECYDVCIVGFYVSLKDPRELIIVSSDSLGKKNEGKNNI